MIAVLRRHYRPIYGSLTLGTLLTLFVVLVLQGTTFVRRAELGAYDTHFQSRGSLAVPSDIVLVGLDETSIRFLGDGRYPIQRRYMAKAINFLHRAGAKAIGVDFIYPTESTSTDDRALATAIRRAGNVVLGSLFESPDASTYIASELKYDAPLPLFASGAAATGVTNVPKDQDGVLRAASLMQEGPGGSPAHPKLYPSLAAEVASVALHKPVSTILRGLPADLMLVNYPGPQDPANPIKYAFTTYQFASVALAEDDPAVFRNKIVLVIPEAVLTGDQHNTPYGDMYGGVAQASTLFTVLRRNPITPAGDANNALITLVLGLLTTLISSRFGIYRGALGVVALFSGYALLTYVLFDELRVSANLIVPETAVVLVFAGVMAIRFATEERQKRRTSKIFGQYCPPKVVEILVNAPEAETLLAGVRKSISVLFIDVRGFTAMSELMEPEDVVAAMDVYLEEVTASVQLLDGTVNKYVGDELMAMWNAPIAQRDHALRAVKSGLDMVGRMEDINRQLIAKGLPSIKYGIGINSGDAVVGVMGSSFRNQYDVIGDTVNTAARLCGAAGGGEIVIGPGTWELIGDQLEVEETEGLRLKGKREPLRAFIVLGLKGVPITAAPVIAASV